MLYIKKIINYLNQFILFDLKFFLTNFKIILKDDNKLFIVLWCVFLPIMLLIFLIMLFTCLINFIYLCILYLYYNYLVKTKKNKIKYIKYRDDKINFKNVYLILIKKIFYEKPKKISFIFFYNNLNLILNFKKNKNKIDFILLFIITYNIIIRIIILIITSIPFIVFKMNTYFILKIKNSWGLKYDKFSSYIKFILINSILDINSDIETYIKKLKIIIKKNKIIFNDRDFKNIKNFWTEFLSKVKDLDKIKNAIEQAKTQTFVMNIKHEKKYNKNLFLNDSIKNNIINETGKTKSHLTIFFRFNNKIIYLNETSKNELLVWNEITETFKQYKLNYSHQGSINNKKITFFTPPIQTKENKIIITQSIDEIIKNQEKKEIIKNAITINMLLRINDPLLEYKYIEKKNIKIITENTNNNIKIELENSELKNSQLMNSFKITEDFINKNKDLINEIPIELRINFIQNCLNNYYNEKSNLFKEIITFYFNKK